MRFKGTLISKDLIPLAFWFRRYAGRRVSLFLFRLAAIEFLSLFSTILVLRPWSYEHVSDLLLYFALAWPGFMALYELGYFMNDFWSESRESGCCVTMETTSPNRRLLGLAIVTRVGIILVALWGLARMEPTENFLAYTGVLAATAVTFVVHNLLFFPWRILTFWCLYLLKFLLCGVFVLHAAGKGALLVYLLLTAPVATGYACKYAAVRWFELIARLAPGALRSSLVHLRANDDLIVPRVALMMLAIGMGGAAVAGGPVDGPALIGVALVLIGLHSKRLLKNLLRRFGHSVCTRQ